MVESERGKEGKPGQGCILELVTAVGNQDSLTGSVDCLSEWNTQGMEKRCRWHLSTSSHPPLVNSCLWVLTPLQFQAAQVRKYDRFPESFNGVAKMP